MSQANVELSLLIDDAWNRRDVEAAIALWDPDGAWYPVIEQTTEGRRTYRGHAGVRQYYEDQALDEIHAEYLEVRDLCERVLANGSIRTRGKASGAATESPFASVIDFRGGKAIRVRTYLDPRHALEAAGLEE